MCEMKCKLNEMQEQLGKVQERMDNIEDTIAQLIMILDDSDQAD